MENLTSFISELNSSQTFGVLLLPILFAMGIYELVMLNKKSKLKQH